MNHYERVGNNNNTEQQHKTAHKRKKKKRKIDKNWNANRTMYIEGANGVRPIGDGLLEVSEASLNKLIASDDINESYDVEQTPFARYVRIDFIVF